MSLIRTNMPGINTPLENILMIVGFIALIAGFFVHGAVMLLALVQCIAIMGCSEATNDFARRVLYITPPLDFLALYLV